MKKIILTDWNFFRWLRFAIGLAVFVQAIIARDSLLGIAGLMFTTMAVLNIGCCGVGGCNVRPRKISERQKDIIYEEVV